MNSSIHTYINHLQLVFEDVVLFFFINAENIDKIEIIF